MKTLLPPRDSGATRPSTTAVSGPRAAENEAHRIGAREGTPLPRRGGPVDGSSSSSRPAALGPGQPLSEHVRRHFERRFHRDFTDVRVHTDVHATVQADLLAAQAFTVGRHIAFSEGAYQPGTLAGRQLIAHELVHTVQQADGYVNPGTVQRQPKPESESDEQRVARQAQEWVPLLALQLANIDKWGYRGAVVTVENTSREVIAGFKALGDGGPRPPGTVPVSKESAAQRWFKPNLSLIALSGKGKWRLDFVRDERGILSLARIGTAAARPKKPAKDAPPRQGDAPVQQGSQGTDEADAIIADIQRTRRQLLNTAAELIEEQNPTRPENLVWSVGPLAIGRLARLRKLRRLGGVAAVIGRRGADVFGKVEFKGLKRSRPLGDLTHTEVFEAFRKTTYRPSSHAVKRMRDPRIKSFGIHTLDDVKKLLNEGVIAESRGLASIQRGGVEAIVNVETGVIVTISPI